MAVQFQQFLNTPGTGRTGRTLGPTATLTFIQNGVELQFSVTSDVVQQYRNLQPRQWSGPEAIYKKQGGPPLGTPWQRVLSGQGTGADDPYPQNILVQPNLVAYYDAPGPQMTGYTGNGVSWLHVIQNFTGWVEGTPATGGAPVRLCEVAAWYSIVSIVDANWQNPAGPPDWQRMTFNKTGTGWTDIGVTPAL